MIDLPPPQEDLGLPKVEKREGKERVGQDSPPAHDPCGPYHGECDARQGQNDEEISKPEVVIRELEHSLPEKFGYRDTMFRPGRPQPVELDSAPDVGQYPEFIALRKRSGAVQTDQTQRGQKHDGPNVPDEDVCEGHIAPAGRFGCRLQDRL